MRFTFLKVFFRSSKTHGVRQALLIKAVPWPFELQTASGRVLLPKKEKLVEVLFCRDRDRTSQKKNSWGVFFLLGKQETRSVRYVKQQNNLVTLLMVSCLVPFSLPIKKKTACKVSEVSVMLHLQGSSQKNFMF